MVRKASEFQGDPMRRQYIIHHSGRNSGARHAVELRRLVLGKRNAAFGFDGFEPKRAV